MSATFSLFTSSGHLTVQYVVEFLIITPAGHFRQRTFGWPKTKTVIIWNSCTRSNSDCDVKERSPYSAFEVIRYDVVAAARLVAVQSMKVSVTKAEPVFLRFLLLLAIIPLAELWLLIELTKRTSLGWTIALVLFTGMLGMSLVRWQGMIALRKIQQQVVSGQSPSLSIISGVLILLAGAFLLTPGIITDTAGFLLLIPQLRMALARFVQKRLISTAVSGLQGSVWVSSFSTGVPRPDSADSVDLSDPIDSAQRPSVQVIDPNQPKLRP
jgi:UPF0716 protein FxsA